MKTWADLDADRARRLIGEDDTGEDLLNEYAVENGLALPVNLETVDLADVARKKPLALLHFSVLRRRLAGLIAGAQDIDYGVPNFEHLPGRDGREPHLIVSPDLAERYPFKTRKLKAILRRLPKAELTPASRALRELKRVLTGLAESAAFSPAVPIDEAEIRETFVAWVRDLLRFRQQQTGGSKEDVGEALARELEFPQWEALDTFMRPYRARKKAKARINRP